MTLDSRLSANGLKAAALPPVFAAALAYSSSEASETPDGWIQLPISLQILDPTGCIIDGIYVQTRGRDLLPVISPDLAWEFEAWEAASDEALLHFEAECD